MNEFTKVNEDFKLYEEGISYEELKVTRVTFDADCLQLDSYTNLTEIMQETNEISKKLFMYGMISESQSKILQQIEDEFSKWEAIKYFEFEKEDEDVLDRSANKIGTKKVKQTESHINKKIMTVYSLEYDSFQNTIKNEKYKLGVIKRVCNSLEQYSFKLHSMKEYNIQANYQK